jgi:hypothetical protein
MTDLSALLALIEKLLAAPEGSRELDAAIAVEVGVAPGYQGDGVYTCPRYTTSGIDTAQMLVPEGWEGSVGVNRNFAQLYLSAREGVGAVGASPAISLCIAALRARASQ